MMSIRFIVPAMLIVLTGARVSGQVPVGKWRTHLPYHSANIVMVTSDKVFCSSTGGLFTYGLEDNSIEKLSKTDGLSDNGIEAMCWSEADGAAVLAYDNANLDILRGNQIINISDIMKKQIPGDKTVYGIYFREGKAYLSCGFGIVVLDLQKLEITETYYIGDNGEHLKINQITSDDTFFYAATDQGVRRAEIDNPFLIDFNSWELVGGLTDPLGSYPGVASMNGRLFVVYAGPEEEQIYYSDGPYSTFLPLEAMDCNELRKSSDHLLFSGESGVKIMDGDFNFVDQYDEGRPRSAILDREGVLWIADNGRGLVRVDPQGSERVIIPDGPLSSVTFDIASQEGIVYTVAGGVTATFNNIFRAGVLQVFREQDWSYNFTQDVRDLVSIAIDPEDPEHLFAASWGYGLVEYRSRQIVEVYNETNSSLQNAVPGQNVIRIGGVVYDDDYNLWMTNTGVSQPLSVLKRDGSWNSYRLNGLLSAYPALGEIIYTRDGHLWGIIPKGNGLFALNMNGTPDDTDDDEYRQVSIVDKNGRVITNDVFALAEDDNGNLWLGTNQGILVIYSPGQLFNNGSVIAQEIVVPRNDGTGLGDPLLQTEKVTCIEVDGANRKWIGTADGGAFLVSENGFEQIYNFNTSNSPLLSNSISAIGVDGVSGEVFFGTDKGIISFRGTATEGATTYENVKVFPNPVRETYEGPIAISGLLAETTVKITDISGNLVNEVESFGGQAIWDGKDFRGNRVSTGVYLVFLANNDRSRLQAHVTKILFIR
jgi:hypothetical protein